jgi:hypothetical protein
MAVLCDLYFQRTSLDEPFGSTTRKHRILCQKWMSALISRERVSTGARTQAVLPAPDAARAEADVKGGGN